MKRLLFILILVPTILFSQQNIPSSRYVKKDPVEFISKNIGKKVGDGCCRDLIVFALGMKSDKDFFTEIMPPGNPSYTEQHRVGKNNIKPGDIILFDEAKDKSGIVTHAHIAIIYKANGNNLVIAEQNVGSENEITIVTECGGKPEQIYIGSQVILTLVSLDDYAGKEFFNNHIEFYRF